MLLKTTTQPLQFIFTRDGFLPEACQGSLSGEDQILLEQLESDRDMALYRMGLETRRPGLSPSAAFLSSIAEIFFQKLTNQPDLEFLRENAAPRLTGEETERLLQSVFFALGAEIITAQWLEDIFARLGAIYAREIGAYAGSVTNLLGKHTTGSE